MSCGSTSFVSVTGTVVANELKAAGDGQEEYHVVAEIKNRGIGTYNKLVGAFTPYNAQPLEEVLSESHNGEAVPVLGAWASKEEEFKTDGYTQDLIKHAGSNPITFSITLRRHGSPVVVYAAVLPALADGIPRQADVQRGTVKTVALSFVQQHIDRK